MRTFISLILIPIVFLLSCDMENGNNLHVEKWGMFEVQYHGPKTGNPYTEVELSAIFICKDTEKEVTGFYDGNGVYKIRFMPDKLGYWTYTAKSNVPQLDDKKGSFECIAPSKNNCGPVEVFNTYHFRYADKTPYKQVGTTCYAWIHQGDSLEEVTLKTLKSAPFNKLRMCIFPKNYTYNENEPIYYPFEKDSSGNNDYSRFNPEYWSHLEKRLQNLLDLGIEADLILFHPYDRWGYAVMPDSVDEFYLKYLLARLSAYRHVWWSAANEFDIMYSKTMADWHRIFEIIYKNDPYNHLRSIHNCIEFYDHTLPWITHASIQSADFERAAAWRDEYKKPLIFDECRYEGDVSYGWGNLTPQEMTAMFWKSLITDTYAGHGETYLHPKDVLWWSKGGELHGQSPERIAFFKTILEETPEIGLEPISSFGAGKYGEHYIFYFDEKSPTTWTFNLPENIYYQVEVIDTWEMKRDTLGNEFHGQFQIDLPGKKYMAVQINKSDLIFPVKEPELIPKGSLFYDNIKIRLIHPYPHTLRYTLDGSIPNMQSTTYSAPILISENTTLKVVSIDGYQTSNLIEVQYKEATLKPAVELNYPKNGLEYAYYKGKWDVMPDFNKLKPIKQGMVEKIDFSMIEDEDYFGVVYKGYIQIPEDNIYSFYSSSDDGSFIFIDGQKVVDNDGVHGVVEKMGQIGLEKGFHAFEIWFFDNWYDQYLRLEIESRNMSKQDIHPSMLFYK